MWTGRDKTSFGCHCGCVEKPGPSVSTVLPALKGGEAWHTQLHRKGARLPGEATAMRKMAAISDL